MMTSPVHLLDTLCRDYLTIKMTVRKSVNWSRTCCRHRGKI